MELQHTSTEGDNAASHDGTCSPRTSLGTAWRSAVVLTFTIVGMAASAWLGAKLVRYDEHLATGVTLPVTVVAGLLVGNWLRAHKTYFAWTILGTFVATELGSFVVYVGHVSLRDPHPHLPLPLSPWTICGSALMLLGVGTAVVAIVSGAVNGHRHPFVTYQQDTVSQSRTPQ